jgi:predicted ribosomally synthesized peptide with SipW-like signal peptide
MDELLLEMVDPRPQRHDAARRRRLVSTVVILGLAGVGVTALTTAALFTDNEAVSGNGITTGTIDLAASAPDFVVPSGGLAPGDAVLAEITVRNGGSLRYRYAVRYQAEDVDTTPGTDTHEPDAGDVTTARLSEQLQLRLYSGVTCTRAGTDAAQPLTSAGHVDGRGALATDGWTALLGDPTGLAQPGDRDLPSQEEETLCVRLDLAQDAGNEYQDTSSSISLRFDAEQTTNNT